MGDFLSFRWGYVGLLVPIHCAPLERGIKTYRDSIDISLLWSEGIYTYRPAGALDMVIDHIYKHVAPLGL